MTIFETFSASDIHWHSCLLGEEILVEGLPEKECELWIKTYSHPINWVRIDSPKISMKDKTVLVLICKEMNVSYAKKYKRRGWHSLVLVSLSIILKTKSEDTVIARFEAVNSASQLLADLYRVETYILRGLILKNTETWWMIVRQNLIGAMIWLICQQNKCLP